MFEKFGDYMYYLLTAPMRQVKRAVNQYALFFQVIGPLYDDCKQKLFDVREAAMIVSAPTCMLPAHGEERGLSRLSGETMESFRLRLELYAEVAEKAGTNEGLLIALRAFGYQQGFVEPFSLYDRTRWAEFIVYLGHGTKNAYRDLPILYQEIQKIKPATSKLAYFVYVDNEPMDIALRIGAEITEYAELTLNTRESLILIRDREFEVQAWAGVAIASYSEELLVRPEDLVLVADRTISASFRFAPTITSYREERLI